MHWLWVAGVGIAALLAGCFIGGRLVHKAVQPELSKLRSERFRLFVNMASDRDLLLRVLRRELANWMIRRDPDRYLNVYRTAHMAAVSVANNPDKDQQRTQLAQISDKYPLYLDFDFVGTHEHVLYADDLGLSSRSFDDVEQFYEDMIIFQALQAALTDEWHGKEPTSERNLEHVDKYVGRVKDTRLKRRLLEAMRQYRTFQRLVDAGGASKPTGMFLFETDQFTVQSVPHFAETRYGVHFRDTDEYALYSHFYDGPERDYHSYYWCNAEFAEERRLDDLRLDGEI